MVYLLILASLLSSSWSLVLLPHVFFYKTAEFGYSKQRSDEYENRGQFGKLGKKQHQTLLIIIKTGNKGLVS